MRIRIEKERKSWLVRVFSTRWTEILYLSVGIGGLCAEVTFPTTWHEKQIGWLRLGFGLFRLGIAFPWHKSYPDYMQCNGPTFGFVFFGDGLHLSWGQGRGTRDDPFTIVRMPWAWRNCVHKVLTEPVEYAYTYTLRSGEVQYRRATVRVETRQWTRPWLPYKLFKKSIDVTFDKEVGERSGSWKGGCTGCGWDMLPHEDAYSALLRMERERKFT